MSDVVENAAILGELRMTSVKTFDNALIECTNPAKFALIE